MALHITGGTILNYNETNHDRVATGLGVVFLDAWGKSLLFFPFFLKNEINKRTLTNNAGK